MNHKYYSTNKKEITRNKRLQEYNELNPSRKLGLIKINETDEVMVYRQDDKFRINPDESLAYRREIKVIFFGSLYAINKYLDAGIFIAHINKTKEI